MYYSWPFNSLPNKSFDLIKAVNLTHVHVPQVCIEYLRHNLLVCEMAICLSLSVLLTFQHNKLYCGQAIYRVDRLIAHSNKIIITMIMGFTVHMF